MIELAKEATALSAGDRLSGLKRIIPRRVVEEALRRSRKDRTCCKVLPAYVVLWFVLAMCLFSRDNYRQVFRWMRPWRKKGDIPARSTLCMARRRVGVAPLVVLAGRVVELLADGRTPGAFYRGMRLMALDGFVLDLADTPGNERVFGRPKGGRSAGAFPQARVAALCEAGTHVVWKWLLKPRAWDERPMADFLLRWVGEGMLLLWDRNFLSYERVKAVMATKAHLLARVPGHWKLGPVERLKDGSYLARVYRNASDRKHGRGGIEVRVIEYTLDDPNRPGHGRTHRLLTTLKDAESDPAVTLVGLYHERWEVELGIDEVKTHQLERPVLRSQTPAGVVQEVYALLLDHFVVRKLMHEAALANAAGPADPRRVSFTAAVKILRCRLPQCPPPSDPAGQRAWWKDLVGELAEEKLEKRRNRTNPRVIKRKMSKWKKKQPAHRGYPQPTKDFPDSVVILR